MNAILLVAIREFRQVAKTRGFLVMLLGLPLIFGLMIMGSRYLSGPGSNAYMIHDASGGAVATALDRRIDQDTIRPDGTPILLRAEIPAGTAVDRDAEAFGASITPLLRENVQTRSGRRQLIAAIYIPKDFGAPGVSAPVWGSGAPNTQLMAAVRSSLTEIVQRRAMTGAGMTPQAALEVQALRAPIVVTQPRGAGGPSGNVTRSAAPLAMMYLLLMAAIMNGSMLLQSLIEERSNKLLESILACIRPDQLMQGKLFGLAAIGLVQIAVWVGVALMAAFAIQGPVGDFMRPAAATMIQPWVIAACFFYFLAGYLAVSLIFLAIGSVSNSMQDAQGYLMPVIFGVMVPVVLMVRAVLSDPDGLFPRVMSWIPVYTPFAMMARLGGGVAIWEVAATGVLLLAFLALEFVLIGRIFEHNILSTGQPPKWNVMAKMLLRKQAG